MTPAHLFDVEGLVVIVTGGASGLGLACADALADNGSRVHLFDIDEHALEVAQAEFAARGLPVGAAAVDITDRAALDAAVARVVAAEGRLDVVFANAGITAGPGFLNAEDGTRNVAGAIENIAPELWQRVVDTNLRAQFATIRAALPAMQAQRSGRIVVTASIAGLRPSPVIGTSYMVAKAGVLHLVRQAALELATHGICVNAIAPGPFLTRITSPELRATWESALPLHRVATADELQGLALFLASPSSAYVTGAHFVIDGGSMLGRAD